MKAKFQELVKVDKLPQKATLHKPAKWLAFEEYTELSKHWTFLPFEDSQPDGTKLLDSVDLEVGALEILWRVLPPYTVMVPVELSGCLLQGSQEGCSVSAELPPNLQEERAGNLKKSEDKLRRRDQKKSFARSIVCPIGT